MMKKLFILMMLTSLSFYSFATGSDSTKIKMMVGATTSLTKNASLAGDIYFGLSIPISSQKLHANTGFSYFNGYASYKGFNTLFFNSFGPFLEANFFVSKNMYVGAKYILGLNFVSKNSQANYFNERNSDSPTFFIGKIIYANVGYHKPIHDKIDLKLQAQLGLMNYSISDGWLVSSGSNNAAEEARNGIESNLMLLYNLSVGLVFKL